ncbi:hypothetical protein MPH_06379 [Macrophomina phaseolina MS6]|uniref:Transcription factor fungi n=1 Tax=Macrophomina phaseolina (strain MS6) TaxID=1126212 RepID=K2SHT0_MACPH|nr:hypothetical protein MPH_06379 [Macrophomina phaseolina MS6]
MCVELARGAGVDYRSTVTKLEGRCHAGEGFVIEGPFAMFQLDTNYQPDQGPQVPLITSTALGSDQSVDLSPSNVLLELDLAHDPLLTPAPRSSLSPAGALDGASTASAPEEFGAIPEIDDEDFASMAYLFTPDHEDFLLNQTPRGSTMIGDGPSPASLPQFSLRPLSPQSFSILDGSSSPISPEGHLLLSHFMNDFVKVASQNLNDKSPWQSLYFPEALKAVGQLTLRTEPSAANLSLLYSLMVISAFHLDRLSGAEAGSGYWWKIAETYQAKSMAHIQISLRHEVVGPKKAKYKTLLMALLALVTSCITNGKLVDARKHLLDAQRLIHLRGLCKYNPSRKVQMLHTMFLYLRVMEEATFVYPLSADSQFFKNDTAAPSSARYPSLAGHKWFGIQEDGVPSNFRELDDFFENSGPEVRQLFSRIYNIPESLVVLMSHITYLCCESRQVKATPHPNPDFMEDFHKRCKVVEDLLCGWTNEDKQQQQAQEAPGGIMDEAAASTSSTNTDSDHGAKAFHGALVIYFYREVHDINRFMLQYMVRDIKAHLLALEGEKIAQNIASASVLWPGFIAAVEAQDQEDFSDICNWMRACADRYGLRSFDRAADVAADFWWARQRDGHVLKWPERVLQKKSFMILP